MVMGYGLWVMVMMHGHIPTIAQLYLLVYFVKVDFATATIIIEIKKHYFIYYLCSLIY